MSLDEYARKLVEFGTANDAKHDLFHKSKLTAAKARNLWLASTEKKVPLALEIAGLYALLEEFYPEKHVFPDVSLTFTGTNGDGVKTVQIPLVGSAAAFYHEIQGIHGETIDCRLKNDAAFIINSQYRQTEAGLHIPDTYTRSYDLTAAGDILRKVK